MRCRVILLMWILVGMLPAVDDAPFMSPIVEVRDGRSGTYGLRVCLMWASLADLTSLNQLRLVELKHGHDVTAMCQFTADAGLSTLIIRFHDGKGDFGSGNRVRLIIPNAALSEPFRKGMDWTLEVDTDVQR
jgi:hypothetical protein